MFSKINVFNGKAVTSAVQVSRGVKLSWNSNGSGNETGTGNSTRTKLVGVEIKGVALDREASYNVVTLDFLAGGMVFSHFLLSSSYLTLTLLLTQNRRR